MTSIAEKPSYVFDKLSAAAENIDELPLFCVIKLIIQLTAKLVYTLPARMAHPVLQIQISQIQSSNQT
jgi:hypothetical protein